MFHPAFTIRNAAKFTAKAVVHARTAQLTEDLLVDHTRYEADDTVVEISSNLVGWYVSDKLKPVTDKIVDTAADKVVVPVKNKLWTKKDTPTETTETE